MKREFLPETAGFLPRPRINGLYEHGLKHSFCYVAAGLGYGKTLSLAYFLKNAPVKLVWVRISPANPDTGDFWDELISACLRELPDLARALESLDKGNLQAAVAEFKRAAENSREKVVFVLDNFESIKSREIEDFLYRLINSWVINFSMFVLSNDRLPFGDFLPEQGVVRITEDALAFDFNEAESLFRSLGLSPTREAIENALKTTEGWPLGLRLLAEEIKRGDNLGFSTASPMQMAVELFEKYYYHDYPEEIKDVLVKFALLPKFSLNMKEDWPPALRRDFLERLKRHPFVSFDYSGGFFYFNAMYHEFLRLRSVAIDPQSRKNVFLQAGRWFLDNQMPFDAMDCFWESGSHEDFIGAVLQMPKKRFGTAITNRILRRLESFDARYINDNPHVIFIMAFMELNAGNIKYAKELFAKAEQLLLSAEQTDEVGWLLGDIYATLADLSFYSNEDTGLKWIKKAEKYMSPKGSRVHSGELFALGNNGVFYLPKNQKGELDRMVEFLFEYASISQKVFHNHGRGVEYLYAGEGSYYKGSMINAAALFNIALLTAKAAMQHDIVCNALWGLLKIEIYYGNLEKAHSLLKEIEDYIDERRLSGLYEVKDSFIAIFNIWLGNMAKVPPWFGEISSFSEEMPTNFARKKLIGIYFLFLTGEQIKARALMLQLENQLSGNPRWLEGLYLRLLHLSVARIEGDTATFSTEFKAVYDAVYHNDLRLLLSSYGKEMMAIIDYQKALGLGGFDKGWLSDIYNDAASWGKRMQAMRAAENVGKGGHKSAIALSKREAEVLKYLATGLTQKEIGKMLNISENTVKKHLGKIYNKLGAANRADAIHIATAGGLVEEV